jgi:hypothetical protein
MLPMYQSEAMWLNFHSLHMVHHRASYPFAVKVAAGKINAVTGQGWSQGLAREPQDYLVASRQPWLDGFCVGKGVIRQFVAMPLGAGYSVEEQVTGEAEFGGLQLLLYPMKRSAFERRFPRRMDYRGHFPRKRRALPFASKYEAMDEERSCEMGLGAGGQMSQEIYGDTFDLDEWDLSHGSRVFVHLVNSLVWRAITGRTPPTTPPTARQYASAGLPWYHYYDETATPVQGSAILNGVQSVADMGKDRGDVPLPENAPCYPVNVVPVVKKPRRGQVREGSF